MEPLTVFSFGYWGWGNATRELVAAVDVVEKARGFGPPLFVDVRISRSVRAVGFRDDAFEHTVGQTRYRWMPGLGNLSVKTRTGPRIQIAEPACAADLLDLALDARRRGTRLLFFCSCERPGLEREGTSCHRVTVARLVRETARKRGVPVETIEWPGGDLVSVDLAVDGATLRAIRRGRRSIALTQTATFGEYAALPWGSAIHLRSGNEAACVLSGPARYAAGAWHAPVLEGTAANHAGAAGRALRKKHGFNGVRVTSGEHRPRVQLRGIAAETPTRLVPALQGRWAELPDNLTVNELNTLAHMLDGYEIADTHVGREASEIAEDLRRSHGGTGEWAGSALQLLAGFFAVVRGWRGLWSEPEDGDSNHQEAQSLYGAVRARLREHPEEVELLPAVPDQE